MLGLLVSKMAAPTGEFPVWLSAKLQALNPDIDLEVFVSYIQGVLETETDREDTIESISGLLAEVLVGMITAPI